MAGRVETQSFAVEGVDGVNHDQRLTTNEDNHPLLFSQTRADLSYDLSDDDEDMADLQPSETLDGRSSKVARFREEMAEEEEEKRPIINLNTSVNTNTQNSATIPRKDGGRVAWQMLIACVFLESATFGLPLSFGIFQEYYNTKFPGNTIASWIGVLSNGIPFLGAPIVTHLCQKYTISRKWYIVAGFSICLIGLLSSAFIPSLVGLIITQGVLYGVGALLVDLTQLIILNTWFDERRGLAYGLVFAGADFFGVIYTFLAQVFLDKVGLRNTMLIFAGMLVGIAGPAIFILHERPDTPKTPAASNPPTPGLKRRATLRELLLVSANSKKTATADLPFTPSLKKAKTWPANRPAKRYYQRLLFYLFNMANFLHASAYYIPFIYLPSFVVSLGHSQMTGATVLAIANFAQVLGDIGFGKLSDILHVNYLIILSTFASSVATFLLWGAFGSGSGALGVLIAYSIIFGSFGAGFLGTWARMGTLFGDKDAQNVYASLSFGRGLASILSGPISQVLITGPGIKALGGKYGDVITYTGACMAGGGLMGIGAILALRFKKEMNGGIGGSKAYEEI